MQTTLNNPDTQGRGAVWLRRYAKALAFATLGLIFIGGMVTSTSSGLSVPDWPTTYGYSMFGYPLSKMVGGIFYEHGHRLVASAVGFMTLVMALWLPFVERRSWVRVLGFAALSAVILQGLLGGLTVLLRLPTSVSVAHGVLAQSFFCLTIILAYSLSVERRSRVDGGLVLASRPVLARSAVLLASVIFLQLFVGAVMRHSYAGLAIPDFPTMGGRWIPRFDEAMLDRVNAMRAAMGYSGVTYGQMVVHGLHRGGAVLVTLALLLLNVAVFRTRGLAPRVARTVVALDVMLVAQIALAAFTIWTQKQPVVTSLHVACGAAMLGVSVLLALRTAPVSARERSAEATVGDWSVAPSVTRADLMALVELAKPRIVSLVLVTTTIGYFLGGHGVASWWNLILTIVGTGLGAGGAAALNNYLERDVDAKMQRTRNRVLPTGAMEPAVALAYGVILVLSGVSLLVCAVNLLAGFLVLLTAFLYVLVYTPLKRLTWLNTPIGAIPGALPPMIGWAAATGHIGVGAWVLFAILFAWQHPHFYSIAWIFRDDYRNAGLKMLSVVDPTGRRLFRQALLFSIALIAVSAVLSLLGITGRLYLYGAIAIGAALLATSVELARHHSLRDARRVLLASVFYLPMLLVLIVIDIGLVR